MIIALLHPSSVIQPLSPIIRFRFSGVMFSTRRSCSHCGMIRSGAVMIASDLVLNPASCECWLAHWHSYLFLSAPSPLRPPCPGLAFCRLGRGSGGRPLHVYCSFPSYYPKIKRYKTVLGGLLSISDDFGVEDLKT